MSWQDDVRESVGRYREYERRGRSVVTPEKRKADEAHVASAALGLGLGTLMMVRNETAGAAELYLWLGLGIVLCIALGSVRAWTPVARVTAVVIVAVVAGGITLAMAALGAFTGSLG